MNPAVLSLELYGKIKERSLRRSTFSFTAVKRRRQKETYGVGTNAGETVLHALLMYSSSTAFKFFRVRRRVGAGGWGGRCEGGGGGGT